MLDNFEGPGARNALLHARSCIPVGLVSPAFESLAHAARAAEAWKQPAGGRVP
jgi:hypothetical protein